MIIYKITHKVSGMAYVGQTTRTMARRFSAHWKERRSNRPISLALQKYGKEAFTVEILGTYSTMEELNAAEIDFIKLYNTQTPNGYNVLAGGKNAKHTDVTKKKLSAMAMGRPSRFKGKTHTPETKALLSKARIGKPMKDDTKAKIAASISGTQNPFYGKTHTAEALAKISASRKRQTGKKRGPYKKKSVIP